MWDQLFSSVAGGSGGGNPTKSGMDNFSGGNFGNVTFGGSAGGFALDKNTLMILGAVAIALVVIMKKG